MLLEETVLGRDISLNVVADMEVKAACSYGLIIPSCLALIQSQLFPSDCVLTPAASLNLLRVRPQETELIVLWHLPAAEFFIALDPTQQEQPPSYPDYDVGQYF